MPEKAPHPDTYESPTNIPTFIEGGTLDDKGSHEIEEISNLPKATTTNGVINLYVTSSHPESNFGGNVNVLNNLFDDEFATSFTIPENEHFDIDYNLFSKLGSSPIINKVTIDFAAAFNVDFYHKQLQISGSFNSDDWIAIAEEPTPSNALTREFIFKNNENKCFLTKIMLI